MAAELFHHHFTAVSDESNPQEDVTREQQRQRDLKHLQVSSGSPASGNSPALSVWGALGYLLVVGQRAPPAGQNVAGVTRFLLRSSAQEDKTAPSAMKLSTRGSADRCLHPSGPGNRQPRREHGLFHVDDLTAEGYHKVKSTCSFAFLEPEEGFCGALLCARQMRPGAHGTGESPQKRCGLFHSSFMCQRNRTLIVKNRQQKSETVPGSKPEAADLRGKSCFPKNQPQRKARLKITSKNRYGKPVREG